MIDVYLEDIRLGIFVFPSVALLLTLPVVWYHYLKFGYVQKTRAVVLYIALFYCIVAIFLVLLPLPEITSDFCEKHKRIPQLIPFQFISEISGNLDGKFTLVGLLKSRSFMFTVFNVLLLFPLGFFLRYLYQVKAWTAVLIGFLASLLIEVTQLTGIFGLYPCAYRFFEVDDLITNTTGTLLGYWFFRYFDFLPSVDYKPLKNWKQVNLTRRFLAVTTDFFVLVLLIPHLDNHWHHLALILGVFLIYFVVLPYFWKGQTPGNRLLGIKLVNFESERVRMSQLFIRYGILLFIPVIAIDVLGYFIDNEPENGIYALSLFVVLGIHFSLTFLLAFFRKDRKGLHDRLARTKYALSQIQDRDKEE